MREGLDCPQTRAVFKQARAKAGRSASKERRGSPVRPTLEEEPPFFDQAHAQGCRAELMMQLPQETGAHASEFALLRVERSYALKMLAWLGAPWSAYAKAASAEKYPCAPNWPVSWPCTSAAAGPGRRASVIGGTQM